MDKFFNILSQRYCSQSNDLVKEDKIQVNAFVLKQHKLIIKACGNLCQQAPEQMVPYINRLLEFMQPQQQLTSDFGKTCKIFFSLPLIAATIGSVEKYKEYNQKIAAQLEKNFYSENTRQYCAEEVADFIENLGILISSYYKCWEYFGMPCNCDIVVNIFQYIYQLLHQAKQSYESFREEISNNYTLGDNEKKQIIEKEEEPVFRCADKLSEVI